MNDSPQKNHGIDIATLLGVAGAGSLPFLGGFWAWLGVACAVLAFSLLLRRFLSPRSEVLVGEVLDLLRYGQENNINAIEGLIAAWPISLDQQHAVLELCKAYASPEGAELPALSTKLQNFAMLLTAVSESIQQSESAIQDLKSNIGTAMEFGRSHGASVEDLGHSAETSSSALTQMLAIYNDMRQNVHSLAGSVDETTTAIAEMTFSSKEVAKNIEDLSTAAEETAASMTEMDVSINQVETNATETSRLSQEVTRDAETGVAAINHTIQGIDNIKESSRVAAEAITNLGQKINQIGNILNVIDDVAEQTNLLALNAAIIAAQAGEHGRGFAVVADEIKALAERTGASTKEIASLIKTIQDESRNAVSVMSRGVDAVDEGVRLGHNAEDALRKIVDSAKRSTLMIQAIAQATVEQAKGSKQVTNAISRIAQTVQQIAFATAEQAKGAEHIMNSAERMKVITQQVEQGTDEQSRGGQQVSQAIEHIREVAERMAGLATEADVAAGQVEGALDEVSTANHAASDSSLQLEGAVGELLNTQ